MTMDIVLIPGLWLNGDTWGTVTEHLQRAGHRVQALTLAGLDSKDADRSGVTLDDHVSAVVAAVDAAEEPALVVGHSASSTLAYCAADARPDKVRRVVYIGGFPSADGEQFMSGLPTDGADAPFPGWEAFEGPDSADLDDAAKARLLDVFVPSPAEVLAGKVRYTDERRYAVPATAICPEYSPDDLKSWMAAGELPELSKATDLTIVDIDSGHWPQVSVPDKLAELILAEAAR
jgi:pimeloyl-ACP methyl ester carboxylesterase